MSGVTRDDRERLAGHRALCVWLTGLSGAGKTTLARAAELELHARRIRTYLVDGDELRRLLSPELGFSAADRAENVRRAAVVARTHVDAGAVAIAALISPFTADRARARARFPEGRFREVPIHCPLAVCQSRDPKGLYGRAARGEISDMTGVGSPYEAPVAPELVIDTSLRSIAEATQDLVAAVLSRLA
ncbi:MAG: adenylyl-sulfate kinase [Myxococcota bacterium]